MKQFYPYLLVSFALLTIAASDTAPDPSKTDAIAPTKVQDTIAAKPVTTIKSCNCEAGNLLFSLDSCRYHFGKIEDSPEQIRLTFYARNIGNKPVLITNANTSCGCDVPGWQKEPILPGGVTRLTYTYDSKRIGPFKKTMIVYYNDTAQVFVMDGIVPPEEQNGDHNGYEGTKAYEKAFNSR